MKFTLDKNFFLVQFVLIIVFYLINYMLVNSKDGVSHFSGHSKSKKIEAGDLMLYVLSQQLGISGSSLTPVSNQAITAAGIQKVIFLTYATGALVYNKSNIEFKIFD
jgi:hypothetical protein